MDTLGIEPRAFRMRSGCDTTTPCAQHSQLACMLAREVKSTGQSDARGRSMGAWCPVVCRLVDRYVGRGVVVCVCTFGSRSARRPAGGGGVVSVVVGGAGAGWVWGCVVE